MNQPEFHTVRSSLTGEADLHLMPDGIVDPAAWRRSAEVDAAVDKMWFEANRGEWARLRPCSDDERRAWGLPSYVQMAVAKGPDGSQFRFPVVPNSAAV